jgi:hypothetical protein
MVLEWQGKNGLLLEVKDAIEELEYREWAVESDR